MLAPTLDPPCQEAGEALTVLRRGPLAARVRATLSGPGVTAPVTDTPRAPIELPWIDSYPTAAHVWAHGIALLAHDRVATTAEVAAAVAAYETGGSEALSALAIGGRAATDLLPEDDRRRAETFVAGAYLVALGRRPDPAGLRDNTAFCLRHGADATLDVLLASPEARTGERFPPAPVDRDRILLQVVQEVVWGTVRAADTEALLGAYRSGRPLLWLLRAAVRRRAGRLQLLLALPMLRRWEITVRLLTEVRASRRTSEEALSSAWRAGRPVMGDRA